MKYAVIMYIETDNIGDDIQTYATLKYLPQIDYIIDREQINEFKSNEHIKAILNGWYLFNNINWPPSNCLEVLPISIHIANNFFKNEYEKFLFEYRTKNYFRSFNEIGCRDIGTSKYLNELGLNTYVSNCLTLTIDKFDIPEAKRKYICAVDLTEDEMRKLRSMTRIHILDMTHDYRGRNLNTMSFDARMKQVEDFLKIYQNATCVVTTRYHAAMPSIALNTSVILIPSDFEPTRYEGLENIITVISKENFLADDYIYDFNNPKPNKNIKHIQNDLEKKCLNFVKDSNCNINSFNINPIEDNYTSLLKKYEKVSEELNNANRILYYKHLDLNKYVKNHIMSKTNAKIKLYKIVKNDTEVIYKYYLRGLAKDYLKQIDYKIDFDFNVDNIPNSILIIPFVSYILPLCWIFNLSLYIDDIDAIFYKSLNNIKIEYQKMIKNIDFKGDLFFRKLIYNKGEVTDKKLQLLLGDIGSILTYIKHRNENIDFCYLWGFDIDYNNVSNFKTIKKSINNICKKESKKVYYVKSNFKNVILYEKINKKIEPLIKNDYWHELQYNLALLGHTSVVAYNIKASLIYLPLTLSNNYKQVSFTQKIDEKFRFMNVKVFHDSFEFAKLEKSERIIEYMKENTIEDYSYLIEKYKDLI